MTVRQLTLFATDELQREAAVAEESVLGSRQDELWKAQLRAQALFDAVVQRGLIRAGALESELSLAIHALARADFGVERHWHRRIVRSGENTLTTFHDEPPDRRLTEDDILYLDFGPVFGEWEADFGRTYVLGADPRKHALARDIEAAFQRGKALFRERSTLTAGELYDYVVGLGRASGWEFGAKTAGHIVDRFPHARNPARSELIRSGNPLSLREPFADGQVRHWILEIHFIDRRAGYGGFLEELLTIDGPTEAAPLG